MRVAEGAHQLALLHELSRRPLDLSRRDRGAVLEDVVDLLGGADGSWYLHLLHAAVGARADSGASESHVRQHERPQLRMIAKKISHDLLSY